MSHFFSKQVSNLSIAIVLIVLFAFITNIRFWEKEQKIIYWDIISYYAYLPATFIYDDISLEFTKDDIPGEAYPYTFWPEETADGELVIKTTMGMSFMYAPFFFIGHLYALNSSFDASGFTEPYKYSLIIGALFWLLIGMIFLRKTLSFYFEKKTIALVILVLGLGTNLFFYSSMEPAMSHLYSFSLISVFMYFILKWNQNPGIINSLILGVLAGVITLIRPTNAIVVLLFILFGLVSMQSMQKRLKFFLGNWKNILLIIAAGLIMLVPQLIYWKYVTGDWFYYSYGSDERFYWNNPHILDGLFSYRKGWLLYTPVMIFSLAGLFLLKDKLKDLRLAIIIYLILHVYIIFSWWSWWYGGSFGMRAMIDTYAVLALPLGAFIQWLFERRMVVRVVGLAVILVLSFYNLFATSQYYYGAIHWDSMTKAAYWHSFGKIKPNPGFYDLLKTPDNEAARKGEDEYP